MLGLNQGEREVVWFGRSIRFNHGTHDGRGMLGLYEKCLTRIRRGRKYKRLCQEIGRHWKME